MNQFCIHRKYQLNLLKYRTGFNYMNCFQHIFRHYKYRYYYYRLNINCNDYLPYILHIMLKMTSNFCILEYLNHFICISNPNRHKYSDFHRIPLLHLNRPKNLYIIYIIRFMINWLYIEVFQDYPQHILSHGRHILLKLFHQYIFSPH